MKNPITDLLKEKLHNLRSEIINIIILKLKSSSLHKDGESYLLSNGISVEDYDSTPVIVGVKILTDHNIELEIEDDDDIANYPTSNFDTRLLLEILTDIENNQK